ncbi:tRNA (adenosine(37)-N6)-threonylcarbamoyltransferase complex ATPase subunit type 1 TsaE [Alkalihalobacillus pseudalcaliphilus]|uniref:tRNA (adenosine(37)-N6)-threonylcarbamoyltransferase complex ATPase subunit type 1 TsaE n=1 Tax=Alkalihalobacillus pseudalcaliphilus TaxID=79884 RepID=UPI00064DE989|nr:tRNA (adenosine(37)-N6)-threonylcarbamoyltransferase complex ATPase subunit type 1 TsaE [Alkalihalobacillus pseudalcaliphilus]KMK74364.1 ATP-binding protein [Alkalihalobacillus pseudalcaliphilus]
MKKWIITTSSPEETMAFAKQLGLLLNGGEVITLEGDLGAGKTHFTKGLAEGLDVKRVVNSPTFTIIKEYKGRKPLYHMDVYRLENSEEDIGLEEYFESDGVSVVEWASRIEEQLPSERLEIRIYRQGDTEREIHLQPIGMRYEAVCKEIGL